MTATVARPTMTQHSPSWVRFILQCSTSIHAEFLGQLQVVSTPVSRPSDVLLSIDTAFVTIETVEVRTANGSSIRAVFIRQPFVAATMRTRVFFGRDFETERGRTRHDVASTAGNRVKVGPESPTSY